MQTKFLLPMQKIFTPILWEFQNYSSIQVDNLIVLTSVFETEDSLKQLLTRFEESLPEISDEVLQKILTNV